LNAYHERPIEVLNTKVYSLIYRFIESIRLHLDNDSLMKELFTLIYDAIRGLRAQHDVGLDETQQIAFTGLYLHKLHDAVKSISFSNAKYHAFLDAAKTHWLESNWDMQQIATFTISIDVPQIEAMITSMVYSGTIAHDEMTPLSILFDKAIGPGDVPSTESNDLQKLFITGTMHLLNEMMQKKHMEQYVCIAMDVQSIAFMQYIESFVVHPDDTGHIFWEMMHMKYCPANIRHEWDEKKVVCKYCGLAADGSNADTIYVKYADVITSRDSGEVVQHMQKEITMHEKNISEAVQRAQREGELFPVSPSIRASIDADIAPLQRIVQLYLGDVGEMTDATMLLRLLRHIVDSSIASESTLLAEILYAYERHVNLLFAIA
jgi:hypothetical protein